MRDRRPAPRVGRNREPEILPSVPEDPQLYEHAGLFQRILTTPSDPTQSRLNQLMHSKSINFLSISCCVLAATSLVYYAINGSQILIHWINSWYFSAQASPSAMQTVANLQLVAFLKIIIPTVAVLIILAICYTLYQHYDKPSYMKNYKNYKNYIGKEHEHVPDKFIQNHCSYLFRQRYGSIAVAYLIISFAKTSANKNNMINIATEIIKEIPHPNIFIRLFAGVLEAFGLVRHAARIEYGDHIRFLEVLLNHVRENATEGDDEIQKIIKAYSDNNDIINILIMKGLSKEHHNEYDSIRTSPTTKALSKENASEHNSIRTSSTT